MNMIIQCASRTPMTSLIICDPKSELYEKSSEYLRDKGYVVRKFDLVTPSSSDSWNCLAEIGGQELMAQLFCDVIIKNTGNGKGDHRQRQGHLEPGKQNLGEGFHQDIPKSFGHGSPFRKVNIGYLSILLGIKRAVNHKNNN